MAIIATHCCYCGKWQPSPNSKEVRWGEGCHLPGPQYVVLCIYILLWKTQTINCRNGGDILTTYTKYVMCQCYWISQEAEKNERSWQHISTSGSNCRRNVYWQKQALLYGDARRVVANASACMRRTVTCSAYRSRRSQDRAARRCFWHQSTLQCYWRFQLVLSFYTALRDLFYSFYTCVASTGHQVLEHLMSSRFRTRRNRISIKMADN